MASIEIRLEGSAAEAVENIVRLTGRDPNQVIADAVNIYGWIISKQLEGHKVVAYKGEWLRPESGKVVPDFVRKDAA